MMPQTNNNLPLDIELLTALPDLNQAVAGDFVERPMHFGTGGSRVSGYCTKCATNWANLDSQDNDDYPETYHYCHYCNNDLYIEPVREDQPKFVYKILQGLVIDITTGELHVKPSAVTVSDYVEYDPVAAMQRARAIEQQSNARQDYAIDQYHMALNQGASKQQAEDRYFDALKTYAYAPDATTLEEMGDY